MKKKHKFEIIDGLKNAISRSRELANGDDLILITGSLFTVGEALTVLDSDNYPKEEV